MSDWCDFTDLKISLRAMADVVRLNILHQLAGRGEITVTDLVSALAISQPLVSWHLRMLRRAGLVRTRRQGREVLCSLDMTHFVACQRTLSDVVAPDSAPASDPPHAPPQPTSTGSPLGAPVRSRIAPKAGTTSHPRARAGPSES